MVESNNAFYRLPERATFESWAQRTPPGFVWAVKMSRYLTHIKRLAEPAEPVQRFLERVEGLGPKLGPVLLQLPPTLRADLARLDQVLRLVTPHARVAVEFRHDSWFSAETRALLEQRGAALSASPTGARGRSRRCGARPPGATCAGTRVGRRPSPATAGAPCARGRTVWPICGPRARTSSASSTMTVQ